MWVSRGFTLAEQGHKNQIQQAESDNIQHKNQIQQAESDNIQHKYQIQEVRWFPTSRISDAMLETEFPMLGTGSQCQGPLQTQYTGVDR